MKNKIIKGVLALVLTLGLCLSFVAVAVPFSQNTVQQTFHVPVPVKPQPINFQNGSFEQPNVLKSDVDATSSLTNVLNQWDSSGQRYTVNAFYLTNPELKWKTTPVNPADSSNPNAYQIEIQCMQNGGTTFYPSGHSAPTGAQGMQYAELNADVPGELYQVVPTVPGTKVYYKFAHMGRGTQGTPEQPVGNDVMNFYLRSPSISGEGNDGLVRTCSDPWGIWHYYTGRYEILPGQTQTKFSFVSVSSASGWVQAGNYLDDISFQSGPSLILEQSITDSTGSRVEDGHVLNNDTVTITTSITNWGETDASRCVLSDVLPENLSFVEGSVRINGDKVDRLVNYNETTKKLSINYGLGAHPGTANTNGGVLKGSIAMGHSGNPDASQNTGKGDTRTITFQAKVKGSAGDVVKNQVQSSYNALGFETLDGVPQSDFTDYTYVNGKTLNSADEQTYVNTFTIGQRNLSGDGVIWIDANENGNIDPGERKVLGQGISMHLATGSGDVVAKDIQGNDLTTTTDANGNYTFTGIPKGVYRIVMDIPSGYRVTTPVDTQPLQITGSEQGSQGTPDNNAIEKDGKAVIGDIDFTKDFTPTTHTYYIHHADIGLIPTTAIQKDAFINASATPQNGDAANPAIVSRSDSINYKITLTNQATNQSDAINNPYAVTDYVPKGLKVTGTSPPATSITPQQDGKTKVVWNINGPISVGDTPITVTATVDENNTLFENSAQVKIGENPEESSNATYHKSEGVTFTFIKTDENGTPLKDVEFQMYQCTNQSNGHVHSELASDSSEKAECWNVSNPLDTQVSNAKGQVTFAGLTTGDYMLAETKTKANYQLPTGQWLLHVDNATGTVTIKAKGDPLPPAFKTETDESGVTTMKLPNYPIIVLPASGGMGTILFIIGGVAFLGIAVILLIVLHKKKR